MNEESKTLIPKSVVYTLLTLSLCPIWFYFFPISEDLFHSDISHVIVHNVFDLTGLFIGIIGLVVSLLGYLVSKDFKMPMLGTILFFTSIFHLIHTIVFYTVKLSGEQSEVSEVYYWTLSSLYSSCAYFVFSALIKKHKKNTKDSRVTHLWTFFGITAIVFSGGYFLVDLENVPNLINAGSLFPRPWEFVSIFIYLGVFAISYQNYREQKDIISYSLALMAIPNIILHINLGFNLADEHQLFFNSHFLRVVAYLFPACGILWSFIRGYGHWDSYYGELDVIQDAVNAAALVSEADANGDIIFANDQFCSVSKYSENELLGKNHRLVNSHYHPKEFFTQMWETISSGKIWKGEICNKAKDGTIYWVDSTIYPSRDLTGKIVKYVSIRFDITERKRLEEKSKFEKKFLEYEGAQLRILSAISKQNEEHQHSGHYFEIFLREFCLNFDWDVGHLYNVSDIGEQFLLSSGVWGTNEREDYSVFKNDVFRSTFQKGEGLPGLVLKDKRAHWVSDIRTSKIYESDNQLSDNNFISALSFPVECEGEIIAILEFHSVKQREVDREFMSVLNKIGTELGALIRRKRLENQILEEKENAENLAKAKSEFLANMSHEIRTPMNGIIGMVSLFSETKLTEKQEEMLATIKNCGDSLLTIVNDVLDFSKMDSGKFEIDYHRFNLTKCIHSVINIVSHKAKEKKLRIGFGIDNDLPDYLIGDDKRIRQVLINFLSNSIKFTDRGEVYIHVGMISEEENSYDVLMSVKDTGIGISKRNQEKLFQAFSQADTSTTRKFGGTGLGLAISSKLATLMHGRVWLESELGNGSIFYLKLSLRKASQIEKEDEDKILPFEVKVNTKTRVLVVEDNKINQKIAKMMLKKIGIECDIVENGVECLNCLDERSYDLIFMDMQMPIMDGVTATKEIVKKYGQNRPRIVAMTANVFKEDKEACFEAGMDDFIAKPISIEEIGRIFKDLAA
jgi:PAS domain S-box-containing protein